MERLKLSVNVVIVTENFSKGNGKLHFFGRDYNAQNECAPLYRPSMGLKKNQRKYTPLYKKDTKKPE